jgi:hypothetical protein
MDSRSHDDFLPPERSVLDDAPHATETVPAAEETLSPAHGEASGRGDLHDAIDDLELELASLLTPDLEAMDIDAVELDAVELEASDLDGLDLDALDLEAELRAVAIEATERAAPGAGATGQDAQDFDAAGRPETAPAASADLPAAEPALALAPETAETRMDAEAVSAEAFETDRLIEAVELELSLDDDTEMLAEEAEAAIGDAGVPAGATVVVAQVVAAPDDGETAALGAMTDAAAEGPMAFEAPAVETPVAQAAEPAGAEPETLVEAAADAAVEQPHAEAQEIAEASAMPAMDDAPAVEAAGQAPGGEGRDVAATDAGAGAERAGGDIVLPGAMLMAPGHDGAAPATAASFEEALGAQDLLATGFEAAVRSAAAQSEGRFLFQMPVHTVHDCQRVAAVNLAGDEAPTTVLVLLRADGRSFRMEDARASDNPFAGMAVSYGGLLAHLKSLPSRAAA